MQLSTGSGLSRRSLSPGEMQDDWQEVISHRSSAFQKVSTRQSRSLESLLNVEVKQANLGVCHARQGARVYASELQKRGLREARVEGDLRCSQHLKVVLVYRLVASTRDVSRGTGDIWVQANHVECLVKGIRSRETIRVEKLHDRAQDRFLAFGLRNRLQSDLPALQNWIRRTRSTS